MTRRRIFYIVAAVLFVALMGAYAWEAYLSLTSGH
jgi:hypothetical protein